MKIGLIVGNGLTIDLCCYTGLELDPCRPFNWFVECSEYENTNLLDALPNAKAFIEDTRQKNPGISDFDILGELTRLLPKCWRDWQENLRWVHCELRHYMAIAYSNLQLRLDNLDKANWAWVKWFYLRSADILGAVSFNYDLTLERALANAGIPYHRVGVTSECRRGIPIVKPHGSIDFEVGPGTIYMPPNIRLKNITLLNDCPIVSLLPKEWLIPRIEADIVLPSEPSPQVRLSWVQKSRQDFALVAPKLERCVIIGSSYWRCDRDEINWFIDQLQRNCVIEVVNPKPPKELLDYLYRRGFTAIKTFHPKDCLPRNK